MGDSPGRGSSLRIYIQIMIILSDTDTNADKFIKVPGI